MSRRGSSRLPATARMPVAGHRPPGYRTLRRGILVGVIGLSGLVGCSSNSPGETSAGGCGRARHDSLDPMSVLHVLAGAPEPHYLEDPPTSGAHQVAVVSLFRGTQLTPISRPQQVGLLEKGQVVIQYRSVDVAPLAPLAADPYVTLAPSSSPKTGVTATAWRWSISCGSSGPQAVSALRSFVRLHEAHGPEGPPPA